MDFSEKTISTKEIFKGKIIDVTLDTVTLPNGHAATRELVAHPGGVGVICVNNDKDVVLVKQYRKPFDTLVEEIPAGKLEYGEDPAVAAKRELEEETGFKAKNLQHIGTYYSSPGFCNEKIYIYLATDAEQANQHPDEDEFLQVYTRKLDELVDEVISGNIIDGKTAIAILAAKQLLG